MPKEGSRISHKNRLAKLVDKVHVGDSRELAKGLPDATIHVTVTSPPYFDMKNYGRRDQIGFGQDYETYLDDLAEVFKEIHRATVDEGSLWIIVDTFRKNQEVFPLPFDIAARIKPTGWILRDIVIWKKERTVPWSHVGITRRIFEYVLIFAKGHGPFHYDLDSFRDTTDLKRWWVRYPERYNPKGKVPDQIWSYDIPTQGSWGDSYIRHFCPLPSDLVSRIIQQTTRPGDIVLDPFAGSGTVPTVSALLRRHYVGFELNDDYVEMFQKHLKRELEKAHAESGAVRNSGQTTSFEETIASLRVLKLGRLVLRELSKRFPGDGISVYAYRKRAKATKKFKHYCADYIVALPEGGDVDTVAKVVEAIINRPPLSKFGIEATFQYALEKSKINKTRQRAHYIYTITNSHSHKGLVSFTKAWESKGKLFSPIKLEVEEPDG